MSLKKNQKALIAKLKHLGIEKETVGTILILLQSDKKAGQLLDWLDETKEVTLDESNILRATTEIYKEKRLHADDFPSTPLKSRMTNLTLV